jgi:hypothetical protein
VRVRASTLLEACAYLAEIATLDPPNSPVARARAECAAPAQ